MGELNKLIEKFTIIEKYLQRQVDNQDGWGDEGEDRPEYCLILLTEIKEALLNLKEKK